MKLRMLHHTFAQTELLYLLDEDTMQIAMTLLPNGMADQYARRRAVLDIPELRRSGFACPAWSVGNLCHLALRHHPQSNGAGGTLRGGYSTAQLKFVSQSIFKKAGGTDVVTLLRAKEGYEVTHTVSHYGCEPGFEVRVAFANHTGRSVTLELLTSFSLDNLSPFALDDAPGSMRLHRFLGGWTLEGKRRADDLERLNLERPWFNCFPESERFGCVGSFPVGRYFPFAAVEDKTRHVFWGAQLAHNASWQMELCRADDTLAFSGGLPDCEFGGWSKNIADGETFCPPKAFISVAEGSLETLCNQLTSLHARYAALQPAVEKELPVICNEWCTSWGHPSQAEVLALAERLRGTAVKYLVIDAGWSETSNDSQGQGGNGEWILNSKAFPQGLRALSRQVREMGMLLGVWFEFEVTTRGSRVFEKEFDALHLTRGGEVICTGGDRTFWDFRKPEVTAYLEEKVLSFLKRNEIGYLKVDYNGSIGIGCDGAESPGEGLRRQMDAVRDFFLMLRRALPELVIENCASGGHRIEPSMTDITALTAATDAHECREGPVLAANTSLMLLTRQNLIMCVLDKASTPQELRFRLSQCFFGRMCISGDITLLDEAQWRVVLEAFEFYRRCTGILSDCAVSIKRELSENIRHLHGMQAALLTGRGGGALLVCHSFAAPCGQHVRIPLPEGCARVKAAFGPERYCRVSSGGIEVFDMPEYEAFALLLD